MTIRMRVCAVMLAAAGVGGCGSGVNPLFSAANHQFGLPSTMSVPIEVAGGSGSEILRLTTPAGAGGLTFKLTSDDPSIVSVPGSVTVLESATSVKFEVTSHRLGSTVVRANAPGMAELTSSVRGIYGVCSLWGDSLAQGNEDGSGVTVETALEALGFCGKVYNEGIGGQWSTQIAIRNGALPSTATITSGVIPASGATDIQFQPFAGAVSDQGPPQSITISGVDGTSLWTGSSYTFMRTNAGSAVTSPASSAVTVHPPNVDMGLVIIWSGTNNWQFPARVKSDIAAMVAHLPSPKRFLVLSVVNGNLGGFWKGTTDRPYPTIVQLNADLAATYPNNFLDTRLLEVAAYDPTNAEDVIDYGHDVPPSTFRAQDFHGNLATKIGDTTSCMFALSKGSAWLGSTITMDGEKIYISDTDGTTVSTCIRGYAGTRAGTHFAGASYTGTDPIHQNGPVAGVFMAHRITEWMLAHSAF